MCDGIGRGLLVPHTGALQQLCDRRPNHVERDGRKRGRPKNKDQIPPGGDMVIDQANSFADAPSSTVAGDGLAQPFTGDEAAAARTATRSYCIQGEQFIIPTPSVAPHTHELIWTTQTMRALHTGQRDGVNSRALQHAAAERRSGMPAVRCVLS